MGRHVGAVLLSEHLLDRNFDFFLKFLDQCLFLVAFLFKRLGIFAVWIFE